jgi:nitrate reductase NapA
MARQEQRKDQQIDPQRLCNLMTTDAVDPISKQPEYKICAVRVVSA